MSITLRDIEPYKHLELATNAAGSRVSLLFFYSLLKKSIDFPVIRYLSIASEAAKKTFFLHERIN